MTLNHQQQQEVARHRSSRYRQLMKRDTQTTRTLTLQGQFSFVASTCLFSWHKFHYFSVQLTAPCKLSFTIYSIKRRPRFKALTNLKKAVFIQDYQGRFNLVYFLILGVSFFKKARHWNLKQVFHHLMSTNDLPKFLVVEKTPLVNKSCYGLLSFCGRRNTFFFRFHLFSSFSLGKP